MTINQTNKENSNLGINVEEHKSELTREEKLAIFREIHDKPTGGHLGMNRTYDRLKLFTSWPGMKQELEYIRVRNLPKE